MDDNENLQPKQFFHGSDREIKGTHILPAEKIKEEGNYPGMHTAGGRPVGAQAFATTNENVAWNFAGHGRGRQRVYQVSDDTGTRDLGLYNVEHPDHYGSGRSDLAEHIANQWKIEKRLDIMPGHQGTFPINWAQFKPGMHWGDVNHPKPQDVEQGHEGSRMRRNYDESQAAQHRNRVEGIENERQRARSSTPLPFDV
jgi:hypothetical protein